MLQEPTVENIMGRPIGSLNRQKPFAEALRLEINAGNDQRHLRAIARKLIEKALDGDLSSIREIADRLDGKPVQAVERSEVSVELLSDLELFAIIRGGSFQRAREPDHAQISSPSDRPLRTISSE